MESIRNMKPVDMIGLFAHLKDEPKTERFKLLIIDYFSGIESDEYVLCRYIYHRQLKTEPNRRFHISELELI